MAWSMQLHLLMLLHNRQVSKGCTLRPGSWRTRQTSTGVSQSFYLSAMHAGTTAGARHSEAAAGDR